MLGRWLLTRVVPSGVLGGLPELGAGAEYLVPAAGGLEVADVALDFIAEDDLEEAVFLLGITPLPLLGRLLNTRIMPRTIRTRTMPRARTERLDRFLGLNFVNLVIYPFYFFV